MAILSSLFRADSHAPVVCVDEGDQHAQREGVSEHVRVAMDVNAQPLAASIRGREDRLPRPVRQRKTCFGQPQHPRLETVLAFDVEVEAIGPVKVVCWHVARLTVSPGVVDDSAVVDLLDDLQSW